MPAIGASTTGVSTCTDPRVRAVGSDMPPLSGVGVGPPKSAERSVLVALVGLLALARLVRLLGLRRLGLRDLTGPGDRVEGLVGAEADGGEGAVVGQQVDQAGVDALAG